jgi:hypothetical protein
MSGAQLNCLPRAAFAAAAVCLLTGERVAAVGRVGAWVCVCAEEVAAVQGLCVLVPRHV